MPLVEPVDDAIWSMIDKHDPDGNVEVEDRLDQYHDMLEGSDIFDGFFSRSFMLQRCSVDLFTYYEPSDWTPTIKLKCGEFNPLESTVEQISHGLCTVLEPATDMAGQLGESRLLSHRLLQHSLDNWPAGSLVGKLSRPARGYALWARYILRAHRDALRSAGIYSAVYASLFDYHALPSSWVRGVAEFWDPATNTCWVGPDELTITLWELNAISGLPVLGHPYEECVPPDEQLFRREHSPDGNRRGRLTLPDVYPRLLDHYRQLHRRARLPARARSHIPLSDWIRSFLHAECLTQEDVLLCDPFRLGVTHATGLSESDAEPLLSAEYSSPALSGIDADLLLAGFLVAWLCTFVLPTKEGFV